MRRERNPDAIIRTAKSGRKYYHNPNYISPSKKLSQRKKDVTPFMQSKDDPYYLRYYEKKKAIRDEYPFWNQMTMSQWREYFQRVYTLMLTDEDYLHWIHVVNEKEKDRINREILERKIQRNKENPFGGIYDEY